MIGCSQPSTRLGCGGLFAQVGGEHLIHADAAAQHGPLLQRRPRQDVAGLAGMDADARRVLVEQARDDVQAGVRSGARGWRLLLSSMSAPAPFAHQFFGLMPLPMNRAANRLGGVAAAVPEAGSLPQTGIDSSQGRAIVTPTPLSKVRRLIRW